MSNPQVILYRHDLSPYVMKADNILLFIGVPHSVANVSPILPRPEITEDLGIGYRRIPILAIGNDVYCDTSLFTAALEKRFTAKDGYSTLFPTSETGGRGSTGLIKALTKFYSDDVFYFATLRGFLPLGELPEAIIKDRSELLGAQINPQEILAQRGRILSTVSSHLVFIEEQLADGRKWLFETVTPSLADVGIYTVLEWAKKFGAEASVLNEKQVPFTSKWVKRMAEEAQLRIKALGMPKRVSGEDALDLIINAPHSLREGVVFDLSEANVLGVKEGDEVEVTPEDTGRAHPTRGTIVGVDSDKVVLEVVGSKGVLRCHFPRLVFNVVKVGSSTD